MSQRDEFHNLDDTNDGLFRELAPGLTTRIFAGEHAMLSQLGCGHVQGFGIARPMPVEDTLDWIARHRARLTTTPRIGSRAR